MSSRIKPIQKRIPAEYDTGVRTIMNKLGTAIIYPTTIRTRTNRCHGVKIHETIVWDPREWASLVPYVFGTPPRGTRNLTYKNRTMYAHNKINGRTNRWDDCSVRGWFTGVWNRKFSGWQRKRICSVQIGSKESTRRPTDPIQKRNNEKEGRKNKVYTRVKSWKFKDTHYGNRICQPVGISPIHWFDIKTRYMRDRPVCSIRIWAHDENREKTILENS